MNKNYRQELSFSEKRWLAYHLARNVDQSHLRSILIKKGISPDVAAQEISKASEHPYIEAATKINNRLEKYIGLLDLYSKLFRMSNDSFNIPIVEIDETKLFFENFYYKNRPALLPQFIQNWPAVEKWNPTYLSETVGNQKVKVCRKRNSNPNYEINFEQHVTEMLFSDFIEEVELRSPTNDIYLVGRGLAFENPGIGCLLNDIVLPLNIIEPSIDNRSIKLWFGPEGTITTLHHDCINILFTQVYGRKRFFLYPSFEIDHLKNYVGVYSNIDIEKIPPYKRVWSKVVG